MERIQKRGGQIVILPASSLYMIFYLCVSSPTQSLTTTVAVFLIFSIKGKITAWAFRKAQPSAEIVKITICISDKQRLPVILRTYISICQLKRYYFFWQKEATNLCYLHLLPNSFIISVFSLWASNGLRNYGSRICSRSIHCVNSHSTIIR